MNTTQKTYKWGRFEKQSNLAQRKTDVFLVYDSLNNLLLGKIHWLGRLNQYIFEPQRDAVLTRKFLLDIHNFLEDIGNRNILPMSGALANKAYQMILKSINQRIAANEEVDKQGVEDAIDKYTEAIEQGQCNASCFYWRGFAKFHLERKQEALQDFDTALKLDPTYKRASEWKNMILNLSRSSG